MTRAHTKKTALVALAAIVVFNGCGGPISLPVEYAALWKTPPVVPAFIPSTFAPEWLTRPTLDAEVIACTKLQDKLDGLASEPVPAAVGTCTFTKAFRVRGRCPSQLRLHGLSGVILTGADSSTEIDASFDGTDGESGYAIEIARSSCVVVEGFEITNYTSSTKSLDAGGIEVVGPAERILLQRNTVGRSGVRWEAATGTEPRKFNSHGILVKGSSASPIKDIAVVGNRLYDLRTGFSESLTITCQVTGFDIHDNVLTGIDNIGIDIAGFHSDCNGTTPSDGRVAGNVLRGQLCGNPAYRDNAELCSNEDDQSGSVAHGAGIYVDGGHGTRIEKNTVEGFYYGIELGGENGEPAKDVTVTGNTVVNAAGCPFLLGASSGHSAGTIGGKNGDVEVPSGEHPAETCLP